MAISPTTAFPFPKAEKLPIDYRCQTENKVIRIAKFILMVLIFPIGLGYLLHALVGRIIVPATNHSKKELEERRSDLFKYCKPLFPTPFTIEVDDIQVDAITFFRNQGQKGRWLIKAGGNNEPYDRNKFTLRDVLDLAEHAQVQGVILFNYPGVGASTGLTTRTNLRNSLEGVLRFVEDEKKGLGAKEIIIYGRSIGGGVVGEAMRQHQLKEDVRYLCIKDRTFSTISDVVFHTEFLEDVETEREIKIPLILRKIGAFLIRILGWNINSMHSSSSNACEIILQTCKENYYQDLDKNWTGIKKTKEEIEKAIMSDKKATIDPEIFDNDKVIPSKASLAYSLLKQSGVKNKIIFPVEEDHNEGLIIPTISRLGSHIENFFTTHNPNLTKYSDPNNVCQIPPDIAH
jgi:hypothetical protein